MNARTEWEQVNQAHLAAGLQWLRLRLAQGEAPVAAVAATPDKGRDDIAPAKHWWNRHAPTPAVPAPVASAAACVPVAAGVAASARDAMLQAEAATPPPALRLLADACGLSTFERQTLLLCAAMEIDSGFGALCARAQGDPAKPHPTFALALALLEEPSWEALAPERPLRALRLLEIGQSGSQPLIAAPLRIDERVAAFLKGLNYLDERLASLCTPVEEVADADDSLPAAQHVAGSDRQPYQSESRDDECGGTAAAQVRLRGTRRQLCALRVGGVSSDPGLAARSRKRAGRARRARRHCAVERHGRAIAVHQPW